VPAVPAGHRKLDNARGSQACDPPRSQIYVPFAGGTNAIRFMRRRPAPPAGRSPLQDRTDSSLRNSRAESLEPAGSRWRALTCRGFGILFDKRRSALCGSAVSTAGRLHRHPTAYDKAGKRRANMPVALVVFLGDLSVPSLKTDQRRATRALKLVLTLAHLFPFSWKQNCDRKVPD
jgi:hypothetical protein